MTVVRSQDFGEYVRESARTGRLVVQPRMGMATQREMAAGVAAVAAAGPRTVATITLDSYTRVGDHDGARSALSTSQPLNGFPLVAHGAEVTAEVAAAAAGRVPVQVRHGSAAPAAIFATMAAAGLSASEGGPVSYCLPYGRVPLAESVAAWRDASALLAGECRAGGTRAHLETFGGCLLGQLCPPSMLVAMSVLEALFFAQQGVESVSLSYAQQTHAIQDIEALAALRILADEFLPTWVERHIVLYTYMGVFPRTAAGAQTLLNSSAEIAVRGGAERLIVKTVAEAHRIPTVGENLTALRESDARAQWARAGSDLPWAHQVDAGDIIAESRALMGAVLQHGDIGAGLLSAFREGTLDVPYCLHADNQGLTQGAVDADGRLGWAQTGRLPLSRASRPRGRLRSAELLDMLNFTADQQDRLGLDSGCEPKAVETAQGPHRVAVVGVGPRGLAVLERTAARLAQDSGSEPVELYAIDASEPGPGRIWRPDQPQWLLMNTPAGEVTMFSGPRDDGPARPGAGPSLAQWWAGDSPAEGDPYAYAPRGTYGRYLSFVLDAVESGLPDRVRLHRVRGRVHRMRRTGVGAGWTLTLDEGRTIEADRVVLATGHPVTAMLPDQQTLSDFAAERPRVHYVRGDSAADMPLAELARGSRVGVLGLGLAFYDVMSLLTEGRGGRYVTEGGELRYVPSGREPRLIAGSRSGVPLPARGRNQKTADHSYQARIFTRERIEGLRSRGKLDFDRQVLPWLLAEVTLVYYATEIRARRGERICELFVDQAVRAARDDSAPDLAVVQQAARFGVQGMPPVDLRQWARPFVREEFADREAYQRAVAGVIRLDLLEAEKGNAHGPVKAALDTLRDVRSTIRAAVDLSGLTARSHEEDFLGSFAPISSHLAAGPPAIRLRQVLALMEAGVLELIGPGVQFAADPERGCFTAHSPYVSQEPAHLDAVMDARIPTPDVRADTSALIQDLLLQGTVTSYANVDDDAVFDTGGMAVTKAPFHPIDTHGQPVTDLYALGIPTEHTRWFTQVGSSRPGAWGEFMADADAIAGDIVTLAPARLSLRTGAGS